MNVLPLALELTMFNITVGLEHTTLDSYLRILVTV